MGFIRLVVFGFIGLSVIYLCVSIYARSVHKEALEDSFDEDQPIGDQTKRDAFVDAGMKAYNSSIRPKLIALVYVVPTVVMGVIIFVINAN